MESFILAYTHDHGLEDKREMITFMDMAQFLAFIGRQEHPVIISKNSSWPNDSELARKCKYHLEIYDDYKE